MNSNYIWCPVDNAPYGSLIFCVRTSPRQHIRTNASDELKQIFIGDITTVYLTVDEHRIYLTALIIPILRLPIFC